MRFLYTPQYASRKNHYTNNNNNKTDYFQDLTDSLLKYSRHGNIIIAGDLNARTAHSEIDQNTNMPWVDEISPQENQLQIDSRLSCDSIINNYGKKLVTICREHNLVIANGRIPGDRIGNYTCYANRGASVVDYFISDQDFFHRLKCLKIGDPAFGSVHSPLTLTVDCSGYKTIPTKKSPLPPPPKFIWDPSKKTWFLINLMNSII